MGIASDDDCDDGKMASPDKWPAINWWKHRGAVEESSGADIPVKSTKRYNTAKILVDKIGKPPLCPIIAPARQDKKGEKTR